MQAKKKNATHTPGPWRWVDWPGIPSGEPGDALLGPTGYGVVWVNKDNSPCSTNLANARLIAAAPDLLAALRRLADMYPWDDTSDPNDGCDGTLSAMVNAAIAKAQ